MVVTFDGLEIKDYRFSTDYERLFNLIENGHVMFVTEYSGEKDGDKALNGLASVRFAYKQKVLSQEDLLTLALNEYNSGNYEIGDGYGIHKNMEAYNKPYYRYGYAFFETKEEFIKHCEEWKCIFVDIDDTDMQTDKNIKSFKNVVDLKQYFWDEERLFEKTRKRKCLLMQSIDTMVLIVSDDFSKYSDEYTFKVDYSKSYGRVDFHGQSITNAPIKFTSYKRHCK